MLGDMRYCYPLTISDYSSRHVIGCQVVASIKADIAFALFKCLNVSPIKKGPDSGALRSIH